MLPVSTGFDIFDWNPRASYAADGSADITGVSGLIANASFSGKYVEANGYLALMALAKPLPQGMVHASGMVAAVMPSDVFTFEAEVLFTDDLPADSAVTSGRTFLGFNNRFGLSAGVLVTKKGFYLASHAQDTTARFLSGSEKYLRDAYGTYQRVVVRLLANATDNRVAVYVGAADNVYSTEVSSSWWEYPDLTLLHNTQGKAAVNSPDGAYISLSARAGSDIVLLVYALRASSTLLTPPKRPVANIAGVWQAAVNTAVLLDGRSSADVFGSALTYDWAIEDCPKDAYVRLQGSVYAQATTVVGAATTSDFVLFSTRYSSRDNDYVLKISNPGVANAELSLSFANKVLTISAATNGVGSVTTTAADVLRAMQIPQENAYAAAISALFTVELALTGSSGDGIVVPGTYAFSGGTGSSLPYPILIARDVGPYVVSLRVNNGTVYSARALFTVSMVRTDELAGEIPDSNYIFKYLPDFWNMVKDKEQLATVWSAITQVVTGDLVTLWQNDFTKSIRDVGRKLQRRWQRISLRVEAPENAIAFGSTDSLDILDAEIATTVQQSGYTSTDATIGGTTGMTEAPLVRGPALYRASEYSPRIVTVAGFFYAGSTWNLRTATPELSTCYTIDSGSALERISANTYRDLAHNFVKTAKQYDVLRAVSQTGVATYEYVSTVNLDGSVTLLAELAGISGDSVASWELVRTPRWSRITCTPYFSFSGGVAALGLALGDLAVVTLTSPYTAETLELKCPVLATNDTTVFVELGLVYATLTKESLSVAGKVWTAQDVAALSVSISYFLRTSSSEKITDLLSAPFLGLNTLEASLVEGRDYRVEENTVQVTPAIAGRGTVLGGADTIAFSAPSRWYSLPEAYAYYELASLGCTDVLVKTGYDAGVYSLTGGKAGTVEIKGFYPKADSFEAAVPRFGVSNPPPDNLWAELAYYDNWRGIEDSFGLMVGLPKQYLVDNDVTADYLTIVRSLVVAFVGGPTLDNLARVADAFIDVPFAEHAGQVISIIEPTTTRDGAVVMHDEFGNDVHYHFPYGAALAENPATHETIGAFKYVSDLSTLSSEEVLLRNNSLVAANTRLFDVSQVDDYISDPTIVERFMAGDNVLQKFHTFVVQVPLEIAKTTTGLGLVRTYLNAAKAAHTKFILVGTFNFLDDIVIEDELDITYSLFLKDTLHTPPFSTTGAQQASTFLYRQAPLADDYVTTKVFKDGVPFDRTADQLERYESGFQEGVLDDFSGDGSVNSAHSEIDMVNNLDFDDIDVLNSYAWQPIVKQTAGAQAEIEFILGEEVLLHDNGGAMADTGDYIWNASPPVIVHVGAGVGLKTPFSYLPQVTHPYTYVILGFNNPQPTASLTDLSAVKSNFNSTARLDGVFGASATANGPLVLVGSTSGARATVDVIPDRIGTPGDRKYFWLTRINQLDKLDEYNLKDEAIVANYVYVPLAGITLTDLANALTASNYLKHYKQVQRHPFDSGTSADEQFVPSSAASVFFSWNAAMGADLFELSYTDVGDLGVTPTPLINFTKDPESQIVENIHVGLMRTRAGGWHKTHGFVTFTVPEPRIAQASWSAGTGTVRVEGFYFIAPDPVATTHTSTPEDYDGTLPGAWVFLVSGVTEYPVDAVTFESGLAAGPGLRTVLGLDGNRQTSTGHILEGSFLVAPPAGQYEVVVRHYYPYKLSAGSVTTYVKMDEATLLSLVVT